LGGGRKHQYWCGWGEWGKLPTIIWVCKNIGECVRWSTTFILTSKESRIGSNKVHNQNIGSWICGFRDG
jgi:23S rRNA A1618 N6-methylase RlmF